MELREIGYLRKYDLIVVIDLDSMIVIWVSLI